jgi:hypothetical protein
VVVADGEVGFFEHGSAFLIGECRFDGDEASELVEEVGDEINDEADFGWRVVTLLSDRADGLYLLLERPSSSPPSEPVLDAFLTRDDLG